MRMVVGLLLILAQVGMIARARFDDARYYCWAPYDSLNTYEIEVEIDGRALDPDAIRDRYQIPARGMDPRAIRHVLDIVSQYERTYGAADEARVAVEYRTNGAATRRWQWPTR